MADYRDQQKWEKKQKQYEAQDARREKRSGRIQRNVIAIAGFVVAANAFIVSFTGWFVWLDLIALLLCLIGSGKRRPEDWKKTLARVGMVLSVIAILNAIRVSNKWVVDRESMQDAYSTIEEQQESGAAVTGTIERREVWHNLNLESLDSASWDMNI